MKLRRALSEPGFGGPAFSRTPRRFSISIFGLIAFLACSAWAQKPGVKPPPQYAVLFVVDISLPMAREKEAIADTLFNLIRTGLTDNLRPGDRLGVWTFNERVYSSRFLPESWTPERGEIIADRVARYLRSLRFEKQSRPNKAVTEILRTAKASKSLTVFMLSNGDTPVVGTPFDRTLNLLYQEYRVELQRAGKPFVTKLTVNHGQFVSWDVSADIAPAKTAEAPSPVQPSGLGTTNSPIAASAPPVRRENLAGAKETADRNPPAAAPPTTTPPREEKPQSTALAPRDDAKPELAVPKTEPTRTPLPPNPAATAEIAKPDPAPVPKPDSPQPEPTTAAPAKVETHSEPIAVTKPPSDARETSTPADSVSPASRAPLHSPDTAAKETRTVPTGDSPGASPPQQALAVPSTDSASSPGTMAFWGVALLVTALSLLYWSARSYRQRSKPSLISRSLNHKGK